jgi:hypothetical protein
VEAGRGRQAIGGARRGPHLSDLGVADHPGDDVEDEVAGADQCADGGAGVHDERHLRRATPWLAVHVHLPVATVEVVELLA